MLGVCVGGVRVVGVVSVAVGAPGVVHFLGPLSLSLSLAFFLILAFFRGGFLCLFLSVCFGLWWLVARAVGKYRRP
ncbi:hypothetical protein BJX99DRAFT_225115 [Aspergillus californicus]